MAGYRKLEDEQHPWLRGLRIGLPIAAGGYLAYLGAKHKLQGRQALDLRPQEEADLLSQDLFREYGVRSYREPGLTQTFSSVPNSHIQRLGDTRPYNPQEPGVRVRLSDDLGIRFRDRDEVMNRAQGYVQQYNNQLRNIQENYLSSLGRATHGQNQLSSQINNPLITNEEFQRLNYDPWAWAAQHSPDTDPGHAMYTSLFNQGGSVNRFADGGEMREEDDQQEQVPSYKRGGRGGYGLQDFINNYEGGLTGRRLRPRDFYAAKAFMGLPGAREDYASRYDGDTWRGWKDRMLGNFLSPMQVDSINNTINNFLPFLNPQNKLSQGMSRAAEAIPDYIDRHNQRGTITGDMMHNTGNWLGDWVRNLTPPDQDVNDPDSRYYRPDETKGEQTTFAPTLPDQSSLRDSVMGYAQDLLGKGKDKVMNFIKPKNVKFAPTKLGLDKETHVAMNNAQQARLGQLIPTNRTNRGIHTIEDLMDKNIPGMSALYQDLNGLQGYGGVHGINSGSSGIVPQPNPSYNELGVGFNAPVFDSSHSFGQAYREKLNRLANMTPEAQAIENEHRTFRNPETRAYTEATGGGSLMDRAMNDEIYRILSTGQDGERYNPYPESESLQTRAQATGKAYPGMEKNQQHTYATGPNDPNATMYPTSAAYQKFANQKNAPKKDQVNSVYNYPHPQFEPQLFNPEDPSGTSQVAGPDDLWAPGPKAPPQPWQVSPNPQVADKYPTYAPDMSAVDEWMRRQNAHENANGPIFQRTSEAPEGWEDYQRDPTSAASLAFKQKYDPQSYPVGGSPNHPLTGSTVDNFPEAIHQFNKYDAEGNPMYFPRYNREDIMLPHGARLNQDRQMEEGALAPIRGGEVAPEAPTMPPPTVPVRPGARHIAPLTPKAIAAKRNAPFAPKNMAPNLGGGLSMAPTAIENPRNRGLRPPGFHDTGVSRAIRLNLEMAEQANRRAGQPAPGLTIPDDWIGSTRFTNPFARLRKYGEELQKDTSPQGQFRQRIAQPIINNYSTDENIIRMLSPNLIPSATSSNVLTSGAGSLGDLEDKIRYNVSPLAMEAENAAHEEGIANTAANRMEGIARKLARSRAERARHQDFLQPELFPNMAAWEAAYANSPYLQGTPETGTWMRQDARGVRYPSEFSRTPNLANPANIANQVRQGDVDAAAQQRLVDRPADINTERGQGAYRIGTVPTTVHPAGHQNAGQPIYPNAGQPIYEAQRPGISYTLNRRGDVATPQTIIDPQTGRPILGGGENVNDKGSLKNNTLNLIRANLRRVDPSDQEISTSLPSYDINGPIQYGRGFTKREFRGPGEEWLKPVGPRPAGWKEADLWKSGGGQNPMQDADTGEYLFPPREEMYDEKLGAERIPAEHQRRLREVRYDGAPLESMQDWNDTYNPTPQSTNYKPFSPSSKPLNYPRVSPDWTGVVEPTWKRWKEPQEVDVNTNFPRLGLHAQQNDWEMPQYTASQVNNPTLGPAHKFDFSQPIQPPQGPVAKFNPKTDHPLGQGQPNTQGPYSRTGSLGKFAGAPVLGNVNKPFVGAEQNTAPVAPPPPPTVPLSNTNIPQPTQWNAPKQAPKGGTNAPVNTVGQVNPQVPGINFQGPSDNPQYALPFASGGIAPRYSKAPSYEFGGYSQAIQQQLIMSEAQRMQQQQQAQAMGDTSEGAKQSYYDRSMMENMNQNQAQQMAMGAGGGQGNMMPSGVYDPTGMAQAMQMPGAADPSQMGGSQQPVQPQIKARIPYYQQMYQKMAQKAAMPKGAVRNITIPKRVGK